MENLLVEKTKSSPYINLNAVTRTLTFRGESFPENAASFYDPVIKWINAYFSSVGNEKTVFEFEIIYFNSSTSKVFMSLFNALDSLTIAGRKIIVNWRATEENETLRSSNLIFWLFSNSPWKSRFFTSGKKA
jgi:hypothetical protein